MESLSQSDKCSWNEFYQKKKNCLVFGQIPWGMWTQGCSQRRCTSVAGRPVGCAGWFPRSGETGWAFCCIKLHAALGLGLSVAKQKEMETSEPRGLELLTAARWRALRDAAPEHSARQSRRASRRRRWSVRTKNIPKTWVMSSPQISKRLRVWQKTSGSAVRLQWRALKKTYIFLYIVDYNLAKVFVIFWVFLEIKWICL